MEQLKELKAKGERDKEALKKAIRAQKERAERSEEYAEQLNVQLAEKVICCSGSSPTTGHFCITVPQLCNSLYKELCQAS